MKLAAKLMVMLSIGVLVMAVLSGFGVRMDWWDYIFGFQLLKASIISALVCAIFSLFLILAGLVKRIPILSKAILAACLSISIAAIPVYYLQEFRKIPTFGEAATDFENLPKFEVLAEARKAEAENPPLFSLSEAKAVQKKYFPDLGPISIDHSPAKAKEQVIKALREMNLSLASATGDDHRVEATQTSFWFGFKDDVVVIFTGLPGDGTRVDVRSASRVGKLDGGANAKRVAAILAAIQDAQ
jgi:uncharacterized protein (DUF1499 family)